MRRLNDVRLNHKVVVEKVRWVAVIGEDPADLSCRDEHRIRALARKPSTGCGLIHQIDILPRCDQHVAIFAFEPPCNRRSGHAAMAGDEYTLAAEWVRGAERHGSGVPVCDVFGAHHFEIGLDHFADQFAWAGFVNPAELFLGFGWIA